MEFAGVAVLALPDGAFSLNAGRCWLLLAALLLSAYNLLQRRLTKTYTALQTTTYSIFAGTLMLAVFLPASVREGSGAPGIQFVYPAVLGIYSSAVEYGAWAKAFSKAEKTSLVSNYMFITPFLTSLLGFLLAGEVPDRATLIGGAVILLGVFLFNFGDAARRPVFRGRS
ncbi:MAG: DMT family transporter [Oscillospiraceae bacterium]|nr:DMT family transporter [Oscillospiraceae bacterium]